MARYRYSIGGSLDHQNPTYVKRKADDELYNALKNGEFCYVLNSRQMGKSSLRVKMAKKLKQEGFKCVSVDMTKISSYGSAEEWYGDLMFMLLQGLILDQKVNFELWLQECSYLSPLQKFNQFIETIILSQLQEKIIIFLDEIDSIIKIKFKDEFFAIIRSFYNQRSENQEYERLTFCLLGVATPSDLIQDKTRTPFNIGQAIELKGFEFSEAQSSLTQGLREVVDNPEEILKEILNWTGGQPFLTQKLCKLVVEKADSRTPNIEQIVRTYIINNWKSQDELYHLKTICDRILQDKKSSGRLLGIHKQVLTSPNQTLKADDSYDQIKLRLSGLVIKKDGNLEVYNRIYQAVFNLNWVEQELANQRKFYHENLVAWLKSGRTDTRQLLSGEILEKVLKEAEEKRLSDEDQYFLNASRDYERQELKQAKEKATKIIQLAQQGTKIERKGRESLELFSHLQLAALRDAIKVGEDLHQLRKEWQGLMHNEPDSIEDLVSTSPHLALQQILSRIREWRELNDSSGGITNVCFYPTGEYLATASRSSGTITFWEFPNQEVIEFKAHADVVWSVCFSSTGEYLATASEDGVAKIWDYQSLKLLPSEEISDELGIFYLIPNMQINSNNRTVKVIGVIKELYKFIGNSGRRAISLCLSENSKYLATTLNNKDATIWNSKSQKIMTLKGHSHNITSICFSPNSQYVATASDDGTAKLWSIPDGQEVRTFRGHSEGLTSICFSFNGEYIATGSTDKTAIIWNLQGNEEKKLSGHFRPITTVCFSRDGKYLATASEDSTAKIWNWSQGKEINTLTGHSGWVTSVCFSPNSKYLATASGDGPAKIWDLQGQKLETIAGHSEGVWSISFSPDGKYLATVSDDGTAKIWDKYHHEIVNLTEHLGQITRLSFSPDGEYLAAASDDRTAILWNLKSKKVKILGKHSDKLRSICFSSDGQWLATASDDKTTKIWNLPGNKVITLMGHSDWVTSVCFNPNDQYLATGSVDKTVKLWDFEGKEIITLGEHFEQVWSVCFSPDGEYLATASADKTIKIWDKSGRELINLRGHFDWVRSVCFSPNGEYLATASDDGTVKVWDLQGNLLADFRGYKGNLLEGEPDFIELTSRVLSVCFTPDGKNIVAGYEDGTVRFWPFESLGELIERGKAWLGVD